jgi:hypothetical protein
MRTLARLCLFGLIAFIFSCQNNQQSGTPTTTPTPPPYKIKMSCNEPFITIQVREDLNQIEVTSLDPTTGAGMVTFNLPYNSPATVSGGYKVFYTGGSYGGVNLDYIIKYKTATPANSCVDDMAGTNHALTGFISVSKNLGTYHTHPACGDNLP